MATFSKMKDCLWSPLLKTLLFFWSTKAPFCVSIKKKMGGFHLQHGLLRNKGQVPPMKWNTCLTTCFVTQADKVHQSKLHLWQLLQGFAAKKFLQIFTIKNNFSNLRALQQPQGLKPLQACFITTWGITKLRGSRTYQYHKYVDLYPSSMGL